MTRKVVEKCAGRFSQETETPYVNIYKKKSQEKKVKIIVGNEIK